MNTVVYLVVPCYNEEEVLTETAKQLKEKMNNMIEAEIISKNSRIVFVNDGSKDRTWEIIQSLHESDALFSGLNLSRNRGHQNALLAGLMSVKDRCDVTISLDADLQDDIHVIDQFIEKYHSGYQIVYGVRNSRTTDSWFKRNTALAFYKFQALMGVEAVYNHADYRLMDRTSLQALAQFREVNLFLRGLVPLVGFRSCTVEYARNERFAGESKYPLKKMLSFAWDGITSFSVKPIRFICVIGFAIFLISLVIIAYCIVRKLLGYTVTGWAFLSCSIWFLGGIQLLGLGIIGEYIGKVYNETKARPRFIVEEFLDEKNN